MFSESLALCWELLIWEIFHELPSRSSFPWYWRYSFTPIVTREESQRQYSKWKNHQKKVNCQSVWETFSIRESPAMPKRREELAIRTGCTPKQDRVDSCITQLIELFPVWIHFILKKIPLELITVVTVLIQKCILYSWEIREFGNNFKISSEYESKSYYDFLITSFDFYSLFLQLIPDIDSERRPIRIPLSFHGDIDIYQQHPEIETHLSMATSHQRRRQ
jgi:hypothetical protein